MSNGAPIIIRKKKVHGGHGHHGGSWKVAYADFVTAMMAFFMVMWIMGLSQQTRSIIAGYFNDPFGKIKQTPQSNSVFELPGSVNNAIAAPENPPSSPYRQEAENLKKLAKTVQDKLQSAGLLKLMAKGVEIHMTPEGLRIELVESQDAAFFKTGSSVLNHNALVLIKSITPMLIKSDHKMILEGHTDSRPYPSLTYTNWDLSSDRANALRRALMEDGVSIHQIQEVRALADTQLEIPSNPYDRRNRRVSILLPYDVNPHSTSYLPADQAKQYLKPPPIDGLGPASAKSGV